MSTCFVTCLNRDILMQNCLCGSAQYTHETTTTKKPESVFLPPPPTDGAPLLLHSGPCSFLPAAPGWARTPQPLLLPFTVAAAIWLANTTTPPPRPPPPSPMRLAGVGSWRRISGWGVGISFPPPQTKHRLRRTTRGREGREWHGNTWKMAGRKRRSKIGGGGGGGGVATGRPTAWYIVVQSKWSSWQFKLDVLLKKQTKKQKKTKKHVTATKSFNCCSLSN